jgi:hypothetical protein
MCILVEYYLYLNLFINIWVYIIAVQKKSGGIHQPYKSIVEVE